MEAMKCLRCGTDMEFAGREQFQLGEESGYSGIWAVMTAESLLMDIFKCPECGKMEFFEPRPRNVPASAPKTNWTCAECGTYNLGRVQNCQGCGVTRAWSDAKKENE